MILIDILIDVIPTGPVKSEVSPPRKLRSIVNKPQAVSEEYDPTQPTIGTNKLSSVVYVTARPKRDHDANKSLIFRAMRDAEMDKMKRPVLFKTDSTESEFRKRKRGFEEEEDEDFGEQSYGQKYRRSRSRDRGSRRTDSRSSRERVSRERGRGDRYSRDRVERVPRSREAEDQGHSIKPPAPLKIYPKNKLSIKDRLGARHFTNYAGE